MCWRRHVWAHLRSEVFRVDSGSEAQGWVPSTWVTCLTQLWTWKKPKQTQLTQLRHKSDVLSSFKRMIFPWNPVFFVSGTHLTKGGKISRIPQHLPLGSTQGSEFLSSAAQFHEWLAAVQELCNIPFKGTYLQEPQATLHASNSWIILEISDNFLDMLTPSFLNFQDVVCSPASVWLYILNIAWWFTKNHHKFLERHLSRQGDGIGSTTFVAFCGWAHQRLRFYYLTWGAINKGLGREIRTEKLPAISRSMTFWTSLLESFLPVASSKQVWE